MVPPQHPAKTVQELIDIAKKRPGRTELCLRRPRLERPSRHRAVQRAHRREAPARALQFAQPGRDGHHERAHLGLDRHARRPPRQHHLGQGARARGLGREPRRAASERADLQGDRRAVRRRDELVRHVRAARHAQGRGREGQPRRQQGADAAGREGARRHARLPLRRRPAGAARRSWLKDEIVKWATIADKANLAKR